MAAPDLDRKRKWLRFLIVTIFARAGVNIEWKWKTGRFLCTPVFILRNDLILVVWCLSQSCSEAPPIQGIPWFCGWTVDMKKSIQFLRVPRFSDLLHFSRLPSVT